MTTPQEGGLTDGDAAAQPAAEESGGQGDSVSSGVNAAEMLKALKEDKEFRTFVEGLAQSRADAQTAKVQNFFGTYGDDLKLVVDMAKDGKGIAEIERELFIQQQMAQARPGQSAPDTQQSPPSTGLIVGEALVELASPIISKMEDDARSQALADLSSRAFDNQAAALAHIGGLVANLSTKGTPSAALAQSPQGNAGTGSADVDKQALANQFEQELAELKKKRGAGGGFGARRSELDALRKKYLAAGLTPEELNVVVQ